MEDEHQEHSQHLAPVEVIQPFLFHNQFQSCGIPLAFELSVAPCVGTSIILLPPIPLSAASLVSSMGFTRLPRNLA